MTIAHTEPIIRPTYMQAREVLKSHDRPVDITRCHKWTLICVHPGSDTPEVIQEIAHCLRHHPDELRAWMDAFGGAVDLTIFLADPLRTLTPVQLSTPCLSPYIPPPLRAPWLHYN